MIMSNVDNEGLDSIPSLGPPSLEQLRASRQPSPVPARADQPGGVFSRLNPGELEEIEARVKAATDGPWTILAAPTGIQGSLPYVWAGPAAMKNWDGSDRIAPVVERSTFGSMADMRFIARAREDVPKLINTIHSLSRRIAQRFNETAEARQDAAAARERAEQAEAVARDLNKQIESEREISSIDRDRVVELNRNLEQARSGHVPGDEADLRRILAKRQTEIEEYRRDAMERTKAIDKIRQRFGIGAGEDLYEGLCAKIGQYQTSEAQLVSVPLRRQIEELTSQLTQANQALEESKQTVKSRDTEISLLETSLANWKRAGQEIGSLVFSQSVVGALEYEGYPPKMERSWNRLIDVVKEIRRVMGRAGGYQEGGNDDG